MQICKKENTIERHNGEHCAITECPTDSPALNIALATITGRYPETGYATNHLVHEMVYIEKGEGQITINGTITKFSAGDVILVEPKEEFFWEGNFSSVISCSPAFTVEQHEVILEAAAESIRK